MLAFYKIKNERLGNAMLKPNKRQIFGKNIWRAKNAPEIRQPNFWRTSFARRYVVGVVPSFSAHCLPDKLPG